MSRRTVLQDHCPRSQEEIARTTGLSTARVDQLIRSGVRRIWRTQAAALLAARRRRE